MFAKFRAVWALPADARRYYVRHRRRGESHEIVMRQIERIDEIRWNRDTINLMW
jgi:hypothetical protein